MPYSIQPQSFLMKIGSKTSLDIKYNLLWQSNVSRSMKSPNAGNATPHEKISSRKMWAKECINQRGSKSVERPTYSRYTFKVVPLPWKTVCSNVWIGFNCSITALVNVFVFASFPSSSVSDCNPLSTLSLQAGIALLWTWSTLAYRSSALILDYLYR